MKIKINKEVIKELKPCEDRYANYLSYYEYFEGNLEEFFELKEISHSDKLWVALRILPRETLEIFAIDCAVSAAAYTAAAYTAAAAYVADSAHLASSAADSAADSAAAAYVAYAAYSAASAANSAAYAAYAAYSAERERQLEALIYLAGRI